MISTSHRLSSCRGLKDIQGHAQNIKSHGVIKRFISSDADTKELEGLVEEICNLIQEFLV